MGTIFYSWQSDLPNNTNRGFIQDALEKAVKELKKDETIEPAVRADLIIDHDTAGVPGSPDISATILAKIDAADVFVADLSIIGEVPRERVEGKRTPERYEHRVNVKVANEGSNPVTGYWMEIEFPTALLRHPADRFPYLVRSRSTEDVTFLRIPKEMIRATLYPGDAAKTVIGIDYYIDRDPFGKRAAQSMLPARATVYLEGYPEVTAASTRTSATSSPRPPHGEASRSARSPTRSPGSSSRRPDLQRGGGPPHPEGLDGPPADGREREEEERRSRRS